MARPKVKSGRDRRIKPARKGKPTCQKKRGCWLHARQMVLSDAVG